MTQPSPPPLTLIVVLLVISTLTLPVLALYQFAALFTGGDRTDSAVVLMWAGGMILPLLALVLALVRANRLSRITPVGAGGGGALISSVLVALLALVGLGYMGTTALPRALDAGIGTWFIGDTPTLSEQEKNGDVEADAARIITFLTETAAIGYPGHVATEVNSWYRECNLGNRTRGIQAGVELAIEGAPLEGEGQALRTIRDYWAAMHADLQGPSDTLREVQLHGDPLTETETDPEFLRTHGYLSEAIAGSRWSEPEGTPPTVTASFTAQSRCVVGKNPLG